MANRFDILLPPGWSRFDLERDHNLAFDSLVNAIARQAPPSQQPAVRSLAQRDLGPRLREFADHGVSCLVMPTTTGFTDPLRPVVTFRPILVPEESDPLLMLRALVGADPTAELADVEGLVAVRTHATADASQAARDAQPVLDEVLVDPAIPKIEVDPAEVPDDVELVSSRVRYTMGDPDDRAKWVDVQMAVDHPATPEAEELARGVIELFDAVISTFRWDS